MKKSMLYLKAGVNVIFYVIALLLVLWLLPKFILFFMPFVIGWIISLIANPVVKFFEEKIKFKRKTMSAIMIILILAVIILAGYGVITVLINQGVGFVTSLPEKWTGLKGELNNLGARLNVLFANLPDNTKETFANLGTSIEKAITGFFSKFSENMDLSSEFVDKISSGIGSIASTLIAIIMCVLSAYFFTAEHNNLARDMEQHLPERFYSKLQAAYRGLKNAVGGYFKAQLKIEFWIFLITLVGLLILRVDFAVIIALGIAILDFLPFFGAGLIMVPWAIISFANEKYFLAVGLLVTWGVGQIVRQIIQPKIVGDSVGFPPLPTLVVMFIGYKFGTVFGMIVAIPVAMIVVSLYQEGVFKSFTESVCILWGGMTEFRRLPDENKDIEEDRKK